VTNFFRQFIEFQTWGWNTTSVSFIGTIVFKQIQTIRTKQSGKSIPMIMSVYFAYHFFTFSVYGFRVHSLAIILNGMFGLLYLKIYRDAEKWGDSDGRTKAEYVFAFLPVLMAIVPTPSVMMALMFVSSSAFLIQCPLEILFKKDAGSVEPKMIFCFIASACFWTAFSACISEWPLCAANIFGIVTMVYTFYLWLKYKKPMSELIWRNNEEN
jgi:uncharacterized protein with PQ loop repeat